MRIHASRPTWVSLGIVAFIAAAQGCSRENNVDQSVTNDNDTVNNITQIFGPEGGRIDGPFGSALDLPPGALTQDVELTIGELVDDLPPLPDGMTRTGRVFAFLPHGQTFSLDATLTIPHQAPEGAEIIALRADPGGAFEEVETELQGADAVVVRTPGFSYYTTAIAAAGDTGTPGEAGQSPGVSVLFVIDNSGSMGEPQARLLAAMDAFVAALDGLDVRIGVTTTDDGNPWCEGTAPEGGTLVASSCRSRLSQFTQMPLGIDATATCTSACDAATHDALTATGPTVPTSLEPGGLATRRPWVERIGGETNLPDGVSLSAALGCLLPQGVDGCGYESPLESMYKALVRAELPGENNEGFMFSEGLVATVVLTDEADCSYDNLYQSIFLPEGMRTFWSDPGASAPTSAVCWNAGVQCSGSSPYDGCAPADLDPSGNAASADAAVLRTVSRYTEQPLPVPHRVYAIAGVPEGYPDSPIVFQDVPGGTPGDPEYQTEFGIGPACTSGAIEAVPSVRLRAVAESSPAENASTYSVCAVDYSGALEAIAADVRAALE